MKGKYFSDKGSWISSPGINDFFTSVPGPLTFSEFMSVLTPAGFRLPVGRLPEARFQGRNSPRWIEPRERAGRHALGRKPEARRPEQTEEEASEKRRR